MDIQARKHYEVTNLTKSSQKWKPSVGQFTASKPSEPLMEQDDWLESEDAHEIINRPAKSRASIPQRIKDWEGQLLEKVQSRKPNNTIQEGSNRVKSLFEVLSDPIDLDNVAPALQTMLKINARPIFLYFISFATDKKSKLVAVKRPHHKEYIHISSLLKLLQEGPNSDIEEGNLLNNFDKGIEIHNAIVYNGIAILDLSEEIAKMGRHVIDDRIEQLCKTLSHFDEIRGVRILIDGEFKHRIGYQGFYNLPSVIELSSYR